MFSRLNWWQWTALGISAIWVMIGGLLGYYVGLHESDGTVSGYSFCLDYKPDGWPPCWQLFSKEFAEATKYQWWDAVIVAFVPIPFGWVIMWGLVVCLRWIFRLLDISVYCVNLRSRKITQVVRPNWLLFAVCFGWRLTIRMCADETGCLILNVTPTA